MSVVVVMKDRGKEFFSDLCKWTTDENEVLRIYKEDSLVAYFPSGEWMCVRTMDLQDRNLDGPLKFDFTPTSTEFVRLIKEATRTGKLVLHDSNGKPVTVA